MLQIHTTNKAMTADEPVQCQSDLCREDQDIEAVTIAVLLLMAEDKTDGVIPLPDESNAATGQPEAEAGQEKT